MYADQEHGQTEIQSLYSLHRITRNAQQRDKFLSTEFAELIIDPFLLRLENPHIEPGFIDPRHCLVFWARPPDHIVRLTAHLQMLLKKAAPSTEWQCGLRSELVTNLESRSVVDAHPSHASDNA